MESFLNQNGEVLMDGKDLLNCMMSAVFHVMISSGERIYQFT